MKDASAGAGTADSMSEKGEAAVYAENMEEESDAATYHVESEAATAATNAEAEVAADFKAEAVTAIRGGSHCPGEAGAASPRR